MAFSNGACSASQILFLTVYSCMVLSVAHAAKSKSKTKSTAHKKYKKYKIFSIFVLWSPLPFEKRPAFVNNARFERACFFKIESGAVSMALALFSFCNKAICQPEKTSLFSCNNWTLYGCRVGSVRVAYQQWRDYPGNKSSGVDWKLGNCAQEGGRVDVTI